MNPNEKYFKSYYCFKHFSKLFRILFYLSSAFMLMVYPAFIFTNNFTYLYLCGGSMLLSLIFSGIDTLCERKCRRLNDDFIDFTTDFFPDTKEEMEHILNDQKDIVEVYDYQVTTEIESEKIIPMQKKDTYERPKIFVKKYK